MEQIIAIVLVGSVMFGWIGVVGAAVLLLAKHTSYFN